MMIRNNILCRSPKRGVIVDTQQQATHRKHTGEGTGVTIREWTQGADTGGGDQA